MNLDLVSLAAPAPADPSAAPAVSTGSAEASGEAFAELAESILAAMTPATPEAPGAVASMVPAVPIVALPPDGARVQPAPLEGAPTVAPVVVGSAVGVGVEPAVTLGEEAVEPASGAPGEATPPSPVDRAKQLAAMVAGALGAPAAGVYQEPDAATVPPSGSPTVAPTPAPTPAPTTPAPASAPVEASVPTGTDTAVQTPPSPPPAPIPVGSHDAGAPEGAAAAPVAAVGTSSAALASESGPTPVVEEAEPSSSRAEALHAVGEGAAPARSPIPHGIDPVQHGIDPVQHGIDPVQHGTARPVAAGSVSGANSAPTAVAAAGAPPSNVPFVDPNVARVGGAVRTLHHEGGRSVSLELTPVELGRVHVELVSRDGHVEVHLQADRAAAADVLRGASAHLRHALEADGLTLDRIGVGVTGDGGRSGAHSHTPDDAGSHPSWTPHTPQPGTRGPSRLLASQRPQRPVQAGGLDVDL